LQGLQAALGLLEARELGNLLLDDLLSLGNDLLVLGVDLGAHRLELVLLG